MISSKNPNESNATELGLCITYPSAGIIERIGADWDWIWIDAQHGQFGYNDILNLVRVCDLINRPAYVRVAGSEAGRIGQVLDMNVAGIVVPCVETAQEAKELVKAAKMPPLGKRSFGGRRVIDRNTRRYAERANHETKLILQIETPEAMSNIESIAAVEGVDALFFGPDDMRIRLGLPMDRPPTEEVLGGELTRMMEVCKAHRLKALTVAVTPGMFNFCYRLGMHMLVCAADSRLIGDSSKHEAHSFRELIRSSRTALSTVVPHPAQTKSVR